MIKYWQSMQDYKYFLTESKVHFDSSERNRLQILRSFILFFLLFSEGLARLSLTLWVDNRILNDYDLHRMFIHTKEHYSFMTTMIGICIHLDARYKQQVQAAA